MAEATHLHMRSEHKQWAGDIAVWRDDLSMWQPGRAKPFSNFRLPKNRIHAYTKMIDFFKRHLG